MTPEQLEEWQKLPEHQVTLRRLCSPAPGGIGLSLQDIAQAELDGVVPDHSVELIMVASVQSAIDRISRARLQASLDRFVDLLAPLTTTLTLLQQALQRPVQPPRQGTQAPAQPPAQPSRPANQKPRG